MYLTLTEIRTACILPFSADAAALQGKFQWLIVDSLETLSAAAATTIIIAPLFHCARGGHNGRRNFKFSTIICEMWQN